MFIIIIFDTKMSLIIKFPGKITVSQVKKKIAVAKAIANMKLQVVALNAYSLAGMLCS